MARPTKAEQAAIAERRATAIRLRIAGVEPLAIGKKLYADPEVNSDGREVQMGYGVERYRAGKRPLSDRALIIRVCQDLKLALEARRGEQDLAVSELREIENARLDIYQQVAHRAVVGTPGGGGTDPTPPDPDAINVALKVMERRARLNGLDAPSQISGPGGGNPLVIEIDPTLLPPRMDGDVTEHG